jgi:hypothetical protein
MTASTTADTTFAQISSHDLDTVSGGVDWKAYGKTVADSVDWKSFGLEVGGNAAAAGAIGAGFGKLARPIGPLTGGVIGAISGGGVAAGKYGFRALKRWMNDGTPTPR